MFGFLCDRKGWVPVNNHLLRLRAKLGPALFTKAMPVILADRGSEFDRLSLLEANDDGTESTKVFYADAYRSVQKAEIESNHRLIRRLIPKGRSFSNLTQAQLDLMFSNINALIRKKQGNRTGYELAKAQLGEDFLAAINIHFVRPEDVILKPLLFEN